MHILEQIEREIREPLNVRVAKSKKLEIIGIYEASNNIINRFFPRVLEGDREKWIDDIGRYLKKFLKVRVDSKGNVDFPDTFLVAIEINKLISPRPEE